MKKEGVGFFGEAPFPSTRLTDPEAARLDEQRAEAWHSKAQAEIAALSALWDDDPAGAVEGLQECVGDVRFGDAEDLAADKELFVARATACLASEPEGD